MEFTSLVKVSLCKIEINTAPRKGQTRWFTYSGDRSGPPHEVRCGVAFAKEDAEQPQEGLPDRPGGNRGPCQPTASSTGSTPTD